MLLLIKGTGANMYKLNIRMVSVTTLFRKQMDQFLAGFNELVPLNLIKIFDEGELELLMGGIECIDVKDWKNNTGRQLNTKNLKFMPLIRRQN